MSDSIDPSPLPAKRKSGSNTRQRTSSVLIRLTPEERAEVEEAASRAGLTVASYGRRQMLGSTPPRSVKRPPIEREAAARLLAALGKIGSNLNQIARSVNTGIANENTLHDALQEADLLKQVIRKAIGRQT